MSFFLTSQGRSNRPLIKVVQTYLGLDTLFIFGLFGVTIPWIGIGSALEGGQTALIGLGINLFILILASLWLIIDFGLVEQHVNNGAPKQMEWFCGFILMVTLVWIYLEALKLCFRLAILFGKKR